MGEGDSHNAGSGVGLRLVAGVLIAAALTGAVGGAALRWVQERGVAAREAAFPPVLILSVADLLGGGRDALAIRALAERLAEGGFLVLDAQAVLAAPSELYLLAGQGTAP